jgi:hypothetical protein
MTPEEKSVVAQKLREVAEILYNDTPKEELATFGTIELSVRKHLLEKVAPQIGEFFSTKQGGVEQEESEKLKPVSVE